MMKCQYLPANQQLEDILPPSVMNRLRKYLLYVRFKFDSWMTMQQYMIGLHPDSFYRALTMHWMRRRPIWIVILLQSLTKSGVSSWGEPFLDMYLSGLSHQLGKQVGAIEKTDEQCQVLNSIDIQYQIYALNQTLDKHEKMRQEEDRLFEMKLKGLSTTMSSSGEPIAAERQETNDEEMNLEDMVAQYNCGNFSRLDLDQDSAWIGSLSKANTSNEFILKEESRIRSELLNKRDKRMASRVIKLLNSHPNRSYFFAFGVAHFLGNHSVLNHLESAGFKLQRYTAKRFD